VKHPPPPNASLVSRTTACHDHFWIGLMCLDLGVWHD
jgi:hypothetical protein